MGKKISQQEFEERCINNNIKPLNEYINYRTNIDFQCLICNNIWNTKIGSVMRGHGCPECGKEKSAKTVKRHISQEDFLNKLSKTNLYSRIEILGKYVTQHSPIEVKCKICNNIWTSSAYKLYRQHGCTLCGHKNKGLKHRKTHEDYIKNIYEKYRGKIDIISEYTTSKANIQFKCNICNKIFIKQAGRLLSRGCPNCNYSKGEEKIKQLLIDNKINFIQQYSFDDLIGINNNRLRFDFAIFKDNQLSHIIEYDGIQHYKSFDQFGGVDRLEYTKKYDNIKNEYCKKNNIYLIRIPYYNYEQMGIEMLLKTTKQVIVMRTVYESNGKQFGIRKGKLIAQGSHASMAFLTKRLEKSDYCTHEIQLSVAEQEWLENSFTKVVCKVNSETELLNIADAAKSYGLECHIITDNGLTEFNGVPTVTCCAIGPDYSEKINKVTSELELY